MKNTEKIALRLRVWVVGLLLAGCCAVAQAGNLERIVVPADAHPAALAAAKLIAKELALPESAVQTAAQPGPAAAGSVVLLVATGQPALKHDGYTATCANGGVTLRGARPRALLFAAGDVRLWRDRADGVLVRDPAFAIRVAEYRTHRTVPEFVAALGCNAVQVRNLGVVSFEKTLPELFAKLDAKTQADLRRRQATDQKRLAAAVQACKDADIDCYPFLYGNDMSRWSPKLLEAALALWPSAKGTPATSSWERAALCPSSPATGRILEAYVREFAQQAPECAGIYATFWDHYGLYCQCDRCKKDGMNQFPKQLTECVRHYHAALQPLGKKLVVRTWSSGAPHWLRGDWVHAPGYGGFGGSGEELWGGVIRELPAEIILQTKVYNADCQPNPPFSPLLGQAKPHPEIAEWQMTGQTTGCYYFPASTVDHTVWTMRKSLELVGREGGVCLYPGGTKQTLHYDMLNDIANSINARAWRELAWDPAADVEKIWLDWATPIYGAKAAPHIIRALRLSESAANRIYSTLGLGSDVESCFTKTIARRETLLKYTNRHTLPEGAQALAPTLENVRRVIAEKDDCLRQIAEMSREVELAKPHLKPELALELATRLEWMREFAICAKALDESLWRYRYLRHLSQMLTTDPEQMKPIAEAYDTVQKHGRRLFRHEPTWKFSAYDCALGELPAKPYLGKPFLLMNELYTASLDCVEAATGPGYLPAAWRRNVPRPAAASAPVPAAPAAAKPAAVTTK